MKGRRAIFMVIVLTVMLSAGAAYGYWSEQLTSQWQVPVDYPVTVEVVFAPREAPADAGQEASAEPLAVGGETMGSDSTEIAKTVAADGGGQMADD